MATYCACGAPATVQIEIMPAYLRDSHTEAGNAGEWPHNGSERSRACADCADCAVRADPEWTSIVGAPSEPAATMTLEQALAAPQVRRMLRELDGCPVGGWPQTTQAIRQLADEIPRGGPCVRDVIDAAMIEDHADRYRLRGEG